MQEHFSGGHCSPEVVEDILDPVEPVHVVSLEVKSIAAVQVLREHLHHSLYNHLDDVTLLDELSGLGETGSGEGGGWHVTRGRHHPQ